MTLADLIKEVRTRELSAAEVSFVAGDLLRDDSSEDTKAAFLAAWATRGETGPELAACAEVFLREARPVGISGSWNGQPLLDCCGTGGGGLNLVNFSTGVMFVLAALGIPVVKHGNRGVTKKSGSADVLEALGIRIDLTPEQIRRSLEEVGGVFLFAPACYPTFAQIAPVRKRLANRGQRTVFNLLGPLLNPARPEARLIGVFQRAHVELFGEALERMGCPRYTVAYGVDGSGHALGEFSAVGPTDFISRRMDDRIARSEEAAFQSRLEGLEVRDASDSAEKLTEILSYIERGFGQEMLVENAARAVWVQGRTGTIKEARALSLDAIVGGHARRKLEQWQEFSRSL